MRSSAAWREIVESVSRSGLRACAAVTLGLLLAGCQTSSMETAFAPEAVLPPQTAQNGLLRDLPPPTERVVVAVYDFPDLTGQFKERENVQSLSKAVTQGGASMLIKALQDAGERRWFTVLERAELDDLLKERQIVTEMRRIYRNETQIDPRALAPLRHAGIILQGGIIGYDTNTVTGGAGARYLGIGADARYQEDTATVTLRAVSTDTGEVLASTTVYKRVASTLLQGNVFRFVMLDRLLEAEVGVTQNEPRQIAVQKAIEKAVQSLIIEGAELGIWSFADPARGRDLIAGYNSEKYGRPAGIVAAQSVPPDTRNARQVVETVPVRPAPARATRPAAPRPSQTGATVPATPAPPPPAENETVGELETESKTARMPQPVSLRLASADLAAASPATQ